MLYNPPLTIKIYSLLGIKCSYNFINHENMIVLYYYVGNVKKQ